MNCICIWVHWYKENAYNDRGWMLFCTVLHFFIQIRKAHSGKLSSILKASKWVVEFQVMKILFVYYVFGTKLSFSLAYEYAMCAHTFQYVRLCYSKLKYLLVDIDTNNYHRVSTSYWIQTFSTDISLCPYFIFNLNSIDT